MVTYKAEVVGKFPGAWNGVQVRVFRCEGEKKEQVGQYQRNYTDFFRTFCHFKVNDRDYALYSPDYTASRIMALPSCKDIGGEEPNAVGFCPVEFFVPRYIERESLGSDDTLLRYRENEPSTGDLEHEIKKVTPLDEKSGQRITVDKPSHPVSPLLYYPFGFVAGCIWGDDSSWKVQYLDLSKAEKGILKRDDRFGYIELPHSLSLREAIKLESYQGDSTKEWTHHISIAVQTMFDLRTGKEADESV